MKKYISISLLAILTLFALTRASDAQISGGTLWKIISNNLQPVVSSWNIYAPANLRFDGEILPDGLTCSNGEILKKTGTNNWDCVADETGTGNTSSLSGTSTPNYIAVFDSTHSATGIKPTANGTTLISDGSSWIGGTYSYTNLSNVPSTFAPEAHATNHLPGASDPLNLSPWMVGAASSSTFSTDWASQANSTGMVTLASTQTLTGKTMAYGSNTFTGFPTYTSYSDALFNATYNASTTLPYTPGITGMVKSAGRNLSLATSGVDYDTAAAWNTNANASTTACFAEKAQTLTNKTFDCNNNTCLNFPGGSSGGSNWKFYDANTITPTSTDKTVSSLNSVVSNGLTLSSIANSILKTVNGVVSAATSGVDYLTSLWSSDVDTNAHNILFRSPTSTIGFVGITATGTVGVTFTAGELAFVDTWDGKYYKCDATQASTTPCMAMAVKSSTSANTIVSGSVGTFGLFGIATNSAWNWSSTSTAPNVLYVSATPGAMSSNPIAGTTGNVGQIAATILSSTKLIFPASSLSIK